MALVVVTGATGLLGRRLLARLRAAGHDAASLRRGVDWDPARGTVEPARLAGASAVVHLAGENLAARRWSAAFKRELRESRVRGTRLMAEALSDLPEPRPALICASAVGWYGERGAEEVDEAAPPGHTFLAEVSAAWEAAADPARAAGCRVAHLRFGMLLAREGGALASMLWPFRLGLGGPVGPGTQYWSWVTLDDAAAAVVRVVADDELRGPLNVVGGASTSRDFARRLGRAIGRPAFLPLPAFAARLFLGEMADEVLLTSARVRAAALLRAGFRFAHVDLDGALRAALA